MKRFEKIIMLDALVQCGEIYSRLGLLNCIIFARQVTGKKELVHRGIREVYVGHFANS